MSNDRYQQGLATQKAVLGEEAAAEINQFLEQMYPPLVKHTVEAFGDMYQRSELDIKTRELINVVTLATQGYALPQLQVHVRAALRAGWKPEELCEVMMQLTMYVGYPAALNALKATREIIDTV